MTAKKIPFQIRQGDVFLIRVDAIPDGAKEMPPTARGVVLADGEITGHAHRIANFRSAAQYATETDQRYLRVTAPVQLAHEEHKTVCDLCPDEPPTLATHYQATRKLPEPERYTCERHARSEATPLDQSGNTYIPPGSYYRELDSEYVPGALSRTVLD
jgi:hypothetical protein